MCYICFLSFLVFFFGNLCVVDVKCAFMLTITLFSSQSAEWCGPDGSVVLIRAVRSGLDRVVLELLRAGVPVNNTDHTGNAFMSQWPAEYSHLFLTPVNWGAVSGVTYPVSPTSLSLLLLSYSVLYPPGHGSVSSSASSSSSSAVIIWFRTKLMSGERKPQTLDNGHINFMFFLTSCFCHHFATYDFVSLAPHLHLCHLSWSFPFTSSSSLPLSLVPPLWPGCVMIVHWLTYSLPSVPSPPLTWCLTGRSALHWACSVNHLSLTRTLIRYGAAVDLQDNKVSPC